MKSETIKARVTKEELKEIKDFCEKYKISISNMLRMGATILIEKMEKENK